MFAENTVIYNESRKQVAEDLVKWRYVLERRGTKVITVKNNNQLGLLVKKRKISGRWQDRLSAIYNIKCA